MASSSTSRSPSPPPPLPPWLILSRVSLVWYDDDDPEDPHFEYIAGPPRISVLALPTGFHPSRSRGGADRHPYVLAAGDAGILLHVSRAPSIGFDLAARYPPGVLVMLRDFIPVDAAAGCDTRTAIATAVRVPDRATHAQPCVANIKHVGLVSLPGSDAYVIAELRLLEDRGRASLLSFYSGAGAWVEREATCPNMAGRCWRRQIDDVISNDGKLWWVNLAFGLLGWDPLADNQLAVLHHVDLPGAFAVEDGAPPQPPEHPEHHRMVRASHRKVMFVNMIRTRDEPPEATLVAVWTLASVEHGAASWRQRCVTSLAEIWAKDSYRRTGMPEQVPVLALLHPANPDVVYFFLENYLFGIDVKGSEVVDFVDEHYSLHVMVMGPPPPPPISWRHVLAWMLPPSLHHALDHEEDVASNDGC